MASFWLTILSLVSGVVSFANKFLEYMKTQENINIGKKIENATIKEKEAEIAIKQAEIIVQHKTKEDTEKQLDNGKF